MSSSKLSLPSRRERFNEDKSPRSPEGLHNQQEVVEVLRSQLALRMLLGRAFPHQLLAASLSRIDTGGFMDRWIWEDPVGRPCRKTPEEDFENAVIWQGK